MGLILLPPQKPPIRSTQHTIQHAVIYSSWINYSINTPICEKNYALPTMSGPGKTFPINTCDSHLDTQHYKIRYPEESIIAPSFPQSQSDSTLNSDNFCAYPTIPEANMSVDIEPSDECFIPIEAQPKKHSIRKWLIHRSFIPNIPSNPTDNPPGLQPASTSFNQTILYGTTYPIWHSSPSYWSLQNFTSLLSEYTAWL